MSGRASEFRLEVAVGAGLTALRRFGWLIGAVMVAGGGLEIAARLLLERAQVLGTDWALAEPAVTGFQRFLGALTAATVYLLTISGARGEPLRPFDKLRRLASTLPVILLAEAVYILPGILAAIVFQGNLDALQAVAVVRGLYHLTLFLSLALLVPVMLDRGPTLDNGVEQAMALIRGRRWPLFVMTMGPLLVVGLVQFLLIGRGARQEPLSDTWPVLLVSYPLYGLVPVVIAAVFLESDGVNGEGPEQLAKTFE